MVLLLSLLMIFQAAPADASPLLCQAVSLQRQDLPNDFPYQMLLVDFAVIRLKVTNRGEDVISVDPGEMTVFDPGGDELDKAASTDITPAIIDFWRGSSPRVHGQAGTVGRHIPRHQRYGSRRGPTTDGPVTVDAGRATRIREKLEEYQWASARVLPGESREAFLYVKSSKSGRELRGGTLAWGERRIAID